MGQYECCPYGGKEKEIGHNKLCPYGGKKRDSMNAVRTEGRVLDRTDMGGFLDGDSCCVG